MSADHGSENLSSIAGIAAGSQRPAEEQPHFIQIGLDRLSYAAVLPGVRPFRGIRRESPVIRPCKIETSERHHLRDQPISESQIQNVQIYLRRFLLRRPAHRTHEGYDVIAING